jgi:hypothetical protein
MNSALKLGYPMVSIYFWTKHLGDLGYIIHLIGGFNPLKNISQIGSSSHLLWKIKIVPSHHPDLYVYIIYIIGSY